MNIATLGGVGGCVLWAMWGNHAGWFSVSTLVLAACAIAANAAAARWSSTFDVSSSLVVALVAAAFISPGAALAVVALAEGVGWVFDRIRPMAVPLNIVGLGAPALATGSVLDLLAPGGPGSGAAFYPWFALLIVLAVGANFAIVGAGLVLHDGGSARTFVHVLREVAPAWGLTIASTVVIASLYATLGISAVVLFVLALLAFT